MIREKLGSIFSSKAFYIVFSILVSIALWLFVEINENQVQPHTVSNVQVVCKNEDLLNDRGLLIAYMSPDNVELTFECTRSVANKLTTASLSVEIDLAGITSRGNPTIRHEVVYPQGVTEEMAGLVSSSVNMISLRIDRMDTGSVNVEVIYSGGAADGYIQDPLEYSPQSIMLSGPADAVSQVGSARVSIIRENLTSTYSDDLAFTLVDENGEELSEALLNQLKIIDETAIHVTVPVRMKKEVALTVELSPGSGATSQNSTYKVTPEFITIAGEPEDVRDFNSLNLGTIDLTSFDKSDTYDRTIAIPNQFTNISGESQASVFVEVHGLEVRHLSVSNIHYVNEPAGHRVDIITQSVVVRIRGRLEDLAGLTEENIRIVADLSGLSAGAQRVQARVYVDGINGDVGAVGSYYVTVSIVNDT